MESKKKISFLDPALYLTKNGKLRILVVRKKTKLDFYREKAPKVTKRLIKNDDNDICEINNADRVHKINNRYLLNGLF